MIAPTLRALVAHLVPFLPGLLTFLAVVGPRALDPRNLGWLQSGDPSTHYLGWWFFRQDEWNWPPGLNPDYGLELSSAIVYSDSIPLLALFFKPFEAWLPQPFQYLGLWLLVCLLLHSYFAWKLVGLVCRDALLRLPASMLLVFSPPMLARLYGHWSLVAHFLVLAALYLALRPGMERRRLAWAALLASATLVHAYFLAMTGLIWLADLAGRAWHRKLAAREACIELPGMLALIVATAWLAGYFSIGSGLADSQLYGFYRANLLTFFDAAGWSHVLPNLPEGDGDYEGFNYIGSGVVFLLLATLPLLPAARSSVRRFAAHQRWLLLAVALLALFGFSHNLGFGSLNFTLPYPDAFLGAAEVFRSSGRMLWPAFYVIVLAVLYQVLKGNRRPVAAVLLIAAVLIQVFDSSVEWRGIRAGLMAERRATLVSAPADPFWEEAARRYANIRVLPPHNAPEYWRNIAAFAADHGMATNAAYLARIDAERLQAAWTDAMNMIAAGKYADDTLYILDATVVEQAQASLSDDDLLQRIEGVVVLAPGWLSGQ